MGYGFICFPARMPMVSNFGFFFKSTPDHRSLENEPESERDHVTSETFYKRVQGPAGA